MNNKLIPNASSRGPRLVFVFLAAISCIGLPGCDLGTYNQRFKQRSQELKQPGEPAPGEPAAGAESESTEPAMED
jgi:hypothetical protein